MFSYDETYKKGTMENILLMKKNGNFLVKNTEVGTFEQF
jgi:hypothetical protein